LITPVATTKPSGLDGQFRGRSNDCVPSAANTGVGTDVGANVGVGTSVGDAAGLTGRDVGGTVATTAGCCDAIRYPFVPIDPTRRTTPKTCMPIFFVCETNEKAFRFICRILNGMATNASTSVIRDTAMLDLLKTAHIPKKSENPKRMILNHFKIALGD